MRPRVRSLGFFPVKRGEKFYGIVRLFSFREEGFPHPYPSMIVSLCSRLSIVLSHIETQEELMEIKERLFQAQKMEALGALAGGIAHNFNNLLTVIIGYASFLKEKEEDPARLRALNNILSAGEQGRALIAGLKDFAKGDIPEKQPLPLKDLLESTLKMVKETIGKGIIIEESIPVDLTIKGNKEKLSSAFMNILINSVDAMPRGGRIWVSLRREGPMALISFRDEGVGMDREVLTRAFEPFFTTKERGTGLGLPTVYGIVKDHGGEVEILSEPGKGTEVRIYLPLEG